MGRHSERDTQASFSFEGRLLTEEMGIWNLI